MTLTYGQIADAFGRGSGLRAALLTRAWQLRVAAGHGVLASCGWRRVMARLRIAGVVPSARCACRTSLIDIFAAFLARIS